MYKIVVNKIRCKFCGDIIESRSVHDFVQCRCGKCSTDGGQEYAQRSFFTENPEDTYEDLSTYLDTETGKLVDAKGADAGEVPFKPVRKVSEQNGIDHEIVEAITEDKETNKLSSDPDIPMEVTEERSDEPEELLPKEGKVTETDKKGKPVAGRYPYGKKNNQ